MRIRVSIEGGIPQGSWILFCNNKKIKIFDNGEDNFVEIPNQGEYEILLTNNLRKNFFWYILLWLGNLLAAPINTLLLNTDDNWYQRIIPTILWRCKCNFQEDANINFRIVGFCINQASVPQYEFRLTSSPNCVIESSYQEMYNLDSFNWEINKYLSKFFSFEFWAFVLLCFVFWYVSFKNWCLVAALVGAFFAVLFGAVTVYTVHKAKRIQKQLKP